MLKREPPKIPFSLNEPPTQETLDVFRHEAAKQSLLWLAVEVATVLSGIGAGIALLMLLPQWWAQALVLVTIGALIVPAISFFQKSRVLWQIQVLDLTPEPLDKIKVNTLLWAQPPKTTNYLQLVYAQEREPCRVEYAMLCILSQEERKSAHEL
jgi:hypothetical protein